MNINLEKIINEYLVCFPNEVERLKCLSDYLKNSTNDELCDWNNTKGHIIAGAFVYSKQDEKFLVLFHKELQMYLYPSGHCTIEDKSPFETAQREMIEETGLQDFDNLSLLDNKLIPVDIDTHMIPYDNSCNMLEHYHFDFRYLFMVDQVEDIVLDETESRDYKWIDKEELQKDKNFGNIINKLEKIITKKIK